MESVYLFYRKFILRSMATNWKSSWGIMQLRSFSVYNSNLDTRFEAGSPSPFSETNCEDQELKECEHAGSIIQLKHDWNWKLYDFLFHMTSLYTSRHLVFCSSCKFCTSYRYCIRQVLEIQQETTSSCKDGIPIFTENWRQGSHIHIKM